MACPKLKAKLPNENLKIKHKHEMLIVEQFEKFINTF